MKMEKEGFLKIGDLRGEARGRRLAEQDRVLLIREGNRLFNQNEIEKAAKIFVSVKYADGLNRIGDFHLKAGRIYVAFKYFRLSENEAKIDRICAGMGAVIKEWIRG